MILIVMFLVCDFIGDFLLQPRWMALGKSVSVKVLFYHVYSLFVPILAGMTIVALFGTADIFDVGFFAAIYAALHGVQDWFLWRLYKKMRPDWYKTSFKFYEDKLFYTFIGADRLAHVLVGISLIYLILIR